MRSLELTPKASLSRAVAAIRNRTLIVNLPGSPRAVTETIGFLAPLLPHALETVAGLAVECASSQSLAMGFGCAILGGFHLDEEVSVLLTQMLPGVIGIVASVLIGTIGVFSNTQKNQALKLVLVVLLVVVAAVGLYRENEVAEASAMEREKTVYAESHAAQSLQELKEAKEALERAGEEHRTAQAELNERLAKNQELLQSLFGRTVTLHETLESLEAAASKGQRHKIAEITGAARGEARQTLLTVVREESLLPESEIAKIEADLEKEEPIPSAALEKIQANMAAKHRLERTVGGTLSTSSVPTSPEP